MTRRNSRELAVAMTYALEYADEPRDLPCEWLSEEFLSRLEGEAEHFELPDENEADYIKRVIDGVCGHMEEIDAQIEKYSLDWKLDRLPRMALAVMRVCLCECLYMPDIPQSAAINEAVEISKHYLPQEMTAFINGVLGSVSRGDSQAEGACAPGEA